MTKMWNFKKQIIPFALLFLLIACKSVVELKSADMNKLELGMTKTQVTDILGPRYTLAEKRMEDGVVVEVLMYSKYYEDNQFYMFSFKNGKLEEWHRETLPAYEVAK